MMPITPNSKATIALVCPLLLLIGLPERDRDFIPMTKLVKPTTTPTRALARPLVIVVDLIASCAKTAAGARIMNKTKLILKKLFIIISFKNLQLIIDFFYRLLEFSAIIPHSYAVSQLSQ
jgi:hypothetical protein